MLIITWQTLGSMFMKCRKDDLNEFATEWCLIHQLQYAIANFPYRLYRRGKNRCLGCGVKI